MYYLHPLHDECLPPTDTAVPIHQLHVAGAAFGLFVGVVATVGDARSLCDESDGFDDDEYSALLDYYPQRRECRW